MIIKNFELLTNEIRKIGNLLIKNKKNSEWCEILDLKKNTTAADYKVDKLLKIALIQFGIDIPYYSEEVLHSIEDRPNEYWLADPIDGTSSWLGGFIGYVVQAVYIKNNQPIFSFVYWPEKDFFYHSYKDKGIFLNNKRIVISTQVGKLVVVDNYPEARGDVEQLMKKFTNLEYLEMGSLGLKSLLVALGSCDLFIKTTKFRDWDILPAKLFINESNFKMLNLMGHSFNFGNQIEFNEGLLVYNPLKIDGKILSYIEDMEKNFES